VKIVFLADVSTELKESVDFVVKSCNHGKSTVEIILNTRHLSMPSELILSNIKIIQHIDETTAYLNSSMACQGP
jgi:hypothetical protein